MTYNKKNVFRVCVISVPILDIIGGDMFLKQFIGIIEPLSDDIYVITGGFSQPFNEKIKVIGKGKAWTVTDSITKRIYRYFLAQLRSSLDMFIIIKHCNILILYSGTQLFLIPAVIAKFFGVKVLMVHQGSFSNPLKVAYVNRWFGLGNIFWRIVKLMEEIIFYLSDRIVVESQSVIDFLKLDRFKGKICIGDYTYINIDLFKIKKPIKERKNMLAILDNLLKQKVY